MLSVCLFVCLSVTILYVTILKNPNKTKTNKARMLFFSVAGTYHRGSIPWNLQLSTPIRTGARGGNIFVYVTILYVTILKNPYKTKTNEARILFFSVEGTNHRGSIPLLFGRSNPISPGARGGSRFWKIPIKQKVIKVGSYIFRWKVPTIGEICPIIYSILPLIERVPGGNILVYVTILYVTI